MGVSGASGIGEISLVLGRFGFFENYVFFVFWAVWKFWREAPGLMRRALVGCKDSSGPVGFDYHELHSFTRPEIGPENLNPESKNQKPDPKT